MTKTVKGCTRKRGLLPNNQPETPPLELRLTDTCGKDKKTNKKTENRKPGLM